MDQTTTSPLQPLSTPISLLPSSQSFLSESYKHIQVIPISAWTRKYTIQDPSLPISSPPLFAITDGKGFSKGFWNYTHILTSATGLPVLECRRQWSKSEFWSFRIPEEGGGGEGGTELGTAGMKLMHLRLHVDIKIKNALSGGQEVVLELRGIDKSGTRFEVKCDGNLVVTVGRRNKFESSPTWEVEVAGGFDVYLGAFIAVMVGDWMERGAGSHAGNYSNGYAAGLAVGNAN